MNRVVRLKTDRGDKYVIDVLVYRVLVVLAFAAGVPWGFALAVWVGVVK